jgi:hypothetical protein
MLEAPRMTLPLGDAKHYQHHWLRRTRQARRRAEIPSPPSTSFMAMGGARDRVGPSAQLIRYLDDALGLHPNVEANQRAEDDWRAYSARLLAAMPVLSEKNEAYLPAVNVCIAGDFRNCERPLVIHRGQLYNDTVALYFDNEQRAFERTRARAWHLLALLIAPEQERLDAIRDKAIDPDALEWLQERNLP